MMMVVVIMRTGVVVVSIACVVLLSTDPQHSTLEKKWKTLQKTFEAFHSQLDGFPHTFQLHNQENLKVDQLKKIQRSLQSALDVGYPTPMETARARNLLAYLLFRLDLPKEALNETQRALGCEDQHHNIVSLANEAVMLWHRGQRNEAEEKVQKLHGLKAEVPDFAYLVVKAKAELAFSYTRFDPSFYPLAKESFTEVLADAKEPEKWLWKFGLAFTLRRELRPKVNPGSAQHEEYMGVLQMFMEIITNCSSDILKAKTYAEVALLLYMPHSQILKETLEKEAGFDVLQACENALELDEKDNSVLWKCGKLYRYLRKTETSCDLLKTAVLARPTSKAYHHLGLTYKALATQEKHKKPATQQTEGETSSDPISDENFRIFKSQLSRSGSEAQGCVTDGPPSAQPQTDTASLSATACSTENSETSTSPSEEAGQRSTKETYEMWRVVKSPLNTVTQFTKGDKYLNEAIDAFLRAVELSEWENTAAVYDLALLYRNIGELELAKEYLEKSLCRERSLGIFGKINAFEQLGLILKDLAENCTCSQEKKRLLENSQSMLLMALKTASEWYAKSPGIRDHIGDIWHSFHTLLQSVDKQEQSRSTKLREKARLFQLIKKHKQSLAFLRDIETMHAEKGNDPEHLKLCIENYVEMEQYEEALAFVDLLQCTTQSEQAMQLFPDKRFLHKVYLQAAEQSHVRGSPNFKSHFRAAFKEAAAQQQPVTSSEDTDTTEGGDETKTDWDVLILHEERDEDANLAVAVATILRDICGMRVSRMDEDVLGGRLKLEGVLSVMKRSGLVVVMAGCGKVSRELRYFLSYAARRSSTVSLLVNGGHVPKMLKTHRSMVLPPELLQVTTAFDTEDFAKRRVGAVCKLFGFLVDIEVP